jgi:uncharacterized protein YciI
MMPAVTIRRSLNKEGTRMAKFVALLTFGNEEQRLATRPRHREYLKSLLDSGKLVMSGPWTDDSGALLLYEAADEAEVRALLAADPYSEGECLAGVEVKEWTQVFP